MCQNLAVPSSLLPDLEAVMREAGEIAKNAQAGITHELKGDGSIVTPADRRVEEFLRRRLDQIVAAPVNGEELGAAPEGENGLWCIDPIDGTSNYTFGSPLWGVSVGLVQGEQVLAGAVYLPCLDEMYMAELGQGAQMNGRALPPIPPGEIHPWELVSYPDRLMRKYPEAKMPGKLRHTGAFVVDATFVCAQRYRGLVGLREKLHDVAACIGIARELNAQVRYGDGSPLLLEPLKEPGAKLDKGWLIFPRASDFTLAP